MSVSHQPLPSSPDSPLPSLDGSTSIWIFGYGSLCWRPDFPHVTKRAGYILGYKRRFYQGSTDHRGTPNNPGRVVTLLKINEINNLQSNNNTPTSTTSTTTDIITTDLDELSSICTSTTDLSVNERTYGMCYLVSMDSVKQSLAYLDHREKDGYQRTFVTVHLNPNTPKDNSSSFAPTPNSSTSNTPHTTTNTGFPSTVTALIYLANNNNLNYLGPDKYHNIADQIHRSVGPSGSNIDYLFNLHRWLVEIEAEDPHVSSLVRLVERMQKKNDMLKTKQDDEEEKEKEKIEIQSR